MPRHPHESGRTVWKISLPADLAMRVDLRCLDVVAGRIAYGSRSALIAYLLREHLQKLEQSEKQRIPVE